MDTYLGPSILRGCPLLEVILYRVLHTRVLLVCPLFVSFKVSFVGGFTVKLQYVCIPVYTLTGYKSSMAGFEGIHCITAIRYLQTIDVEGKKVPGAKQIASSMRMHMSCWDYKHNAT